MKTWLYKLVDKHIILHDIHLASSLLWPCQRDIVTHKTTEALDKAKDAFKKYLSKFSFKEISNVENDIVSAPAQSTNIPSFLKELVNLNSGPAPPRMSPTAEFVSYMDDTFPFPGCDIVNFWTSHATKRKYPYLTTFAKHLLQIPATETASERNFSDAGRILEERRNRLKPELVDDMLVIRSNCKGKIYSE
ncbi:Zinc finger BED domain-containing protein-like protein [Leptotrombidium deliense]|uniref:Zinc finger BED domain-containing protein-like protein n=1 Tax=Leptotrombidium deliense TaxID=299467 RepID=A0A443RWZ8_9ACAR|nr:Zinc finger BED domain-containing protein-like protein [Leptotrombidium deliense]